MKNKLFLILAIPVIITCCKKDDVIKGSNNIPTLSGIWIIDSTEIIYYQNDIINFSTMSEGTNTYIDFFSPDQAYYQNNYLHDTTNYVLGGSNTIFIDLDDDNILDTTQVITLVQNQKLLFDCTKNYNSVYKMEQKIYMHK